MIDVGVASRAPGTIAANPPETFEWLTQDCTHHRRHHRSPAPDQSPDE